MTSTQGLRVLSLNVRKQPEALLSLLNTTDPRNTDILCIQEAPTTLLTRPSLQSPKWRLLIPPTASPDNPPRSVIYINALIPTDSYQSIPTNTLDITALTLHLQSSTLPVLIFSIYNPPRSTLTIQDTNTLLNSISNPANIILIGDFNLHHPLWTGDFFPQRTRACDATSLIDLLTSHHLSLALPPATPTFFSSSRNSWSTLDLVFVSNALVGEVQRCHTDTGHGSDHLAVVLDIATDIPRHDPPRRFKWKEADWELFTKHSEAYLLRTKVQQRVQRLRTTAEVDGVVNDLSRAFTAAAGVAVPQTNPSPFQKRWWTPQLKQLKGRLRYLQHQQQRRPLHPQLRQQVTDARNEYHSAIRRTKRQHWLDYLGSIDSKSLWDATRYMNSEGFAQHTGLPTLQGPGGPARHNREKCQLLHNTFFPPPSAADLADTVSYRYPSPVPAQPISEEEIELAINLASPHKAPGPNGIPTIALQRLAPTLRPILAPLFNALLRLNYHPAQWRQSTTIVLRKPGKPDYSIPKAYRPIALQDTLSKVMESVIARRLSSWAESHQLLPATHFGGRAGRTTTDAVLTLTHFIKDAWRRGDVVSSLFLDISQAFPSVSHPRLLHNLRKRRIPVSITHWLSSFLSHRTTTITFGDFASTPLSASAGIPQGSPLSPILYLFYSADLLEIFDNSNMRRNRNREAALGFIDDTALAVRGPSVQHNVDTLTRLGPHLERWSLTHACRFDLPKFQLTHFTRNPKKYWAIPLTIGTHTIHAQDAARYLGITIDRQLRWHNHVEASIAKGTNAILAISRLASSTTGIPPRYIRQLYNSIVLPKITYGMVVWHEPVRPLQTTQDRPEDTVGAAGARPTRQKGAVGVERRLGKIQNMAARLITGAFRSTPIPLLDYHAGLPPFHLTLQRKAFLATARLATLPREHPLHATIQRAARYRPRFHHTAAHELFHTFPQLRQVETVSHRPFVPAISPASIHIAESRDDALQQWEADKDSFHIYTDGTVHGEHAGAAAICPRGTRGSTVRHVFLGQSADRSVTDAELAGLYAAADLVTHNARQNKVTIWSDCQHALRLLQNPRPLSGQYTVQSIHDKLRRVFHQRPRLQLKIAWIPGHSNIPGNDTAHREARRAASFKLTSDTLRTQSFANAPPTISALRQDFEKQLKLAWQEGWNASPAGSRIRDIDSTPVGTKALKQFADLPRAAASRIIQLRTRHVALNKFLHRIRRADSPLCIRCQEPETVTHFLFQCRRYAAHRLTLFQAIGSQRPDSKLVLGTPEHFRKLTLFLMSTNRLPFTPTLAP